MKTAVAPVGKNNSGTDIIKKLLLYRNNYLMLITAFLLGNSSIAGGFVPFGAVFFAAVFRAAGMKFLIAAAVLSGVALQGSLELVYINAVCMFLYYVLCIPLKSSNSRTSVKAAVSLFAAILMPQLMLSGLQGFLLYDILKSFFSSCIAIALYFIFMFSVPVMAGTAKKAIFTGEETISIVVTASLALSGIGAIRIFGFSARNIICVIVLLLFSLKCGAGIGAAAGAAIGMITGISLEATPSVIGAYALCGMLAGILGNLGKPGSAFGFILGNMILAACLNGAMESMLYMREIIAAVIVFFAIPNRLIIMLTSPFKRDMAFLADKKGYSYRIRDITAEKLDKFSRAFMELSKTFAEIAETKASAGKHDIDVLFDRVADRICRDCGLCMHCWERNFYDTYQVMFRIVERLEAKGRVEEKDIPAYFIDKCPRINEFVNTVNNMYELFRVGIIWKSKLNESRSVLSRQFEGMSRVIADLADEINNEISFMGPLENEIASALHNTGIKVKEVTAYENEWGRYVISILHNACGGARYCKSIVEKVVSETAGRKMACENGECRKGINGNCSLRLLEAENLKITTGIARLSKYGSNVSGDSFSFVYGGNGKYTLALSDGMGSGYGAAAQSKAAINMLESFLESGFDKTMAVNLINSVLVLKSCEETSCTIDLSIIDLFIGKVEFVKIGAAPTYIKRQGKVDIIKSASLPAGILPGIDTELAARDVESGDMVIMVTDGIIDSMAGDEAGDRRLMKFIQQLNSLNPQQIADSILNEANKCCDNKPCDDLTVLVAKVWKKPD